MSAYPEWMSEGICSSVDPELFFPESGGSIRQAKQVCRKCPVVDRCAAWALAQEESLPGVWGAMGERERRDLRALARRAA